MILLSAILPALATSFPSIWKQYRRLKWNSWHLLPKNADQCGSLSLSWDVSKPNRTTENWYVFFLRSSNHRYWSTQQSRRPIRCPRKPLCCPIVAKCVLSESEKRYNHPEEQYAPYQTGLWTKTFQRAANLPSYPGHSWEIYSRLFISR